MEIKQYKRILKTSYDIYHSNLDEGGYGVSLVPNYTTSKHEFDDLIGILPEEDGPKEVVLPFEHLRGRGIVARTFLIEPPIFMPKLREELCKSDVRILTETFADENDVFQKLQERIIVNCTGLGSGKIWPDKSLKAKKGNLVLLPAQPDLKYLYSGHGYLFPRKDCVVLGGTFYDCVDDSR